MAHLREAVAQNNSLASSKLNLTKAKNNVTQTRKRINDMEEECGGQFSAAQLKVYHHRQAALKKHLQDFESLEAQIIALSGDGSAPYHSDGESENLKKRDKSSDSDFDRGKRSTKRLYLSFEVFFSFPH